MARQTTNQLERMGVAGGAFAIAADVHSAEAILTALLRRVEYEPNTGCWLWSGSTVRRGYGGLTINRRCVQTHRLSYALHRGPPGAMWVLHRCDTPACCNPDHLFLGSAQTNVADRVAKGRSRGGSPAGAKHWKAKLTQEDVVEIRRQAATANYREIGARFGISRNYAGEIIRGTKWKL